MFERPAWGSSSAWSSLLWFLMVAGLTERHKKHKTMQHCFFILLPN